MSLQHDHERTAAGGLDHLVEAACALSKLVEASQLTKARNDKEASCISSEPPVERSVISDDEEENSKKPSARAKREIFPQRLMVMLNDSFLSDIITWLPDGHSFVVIRPDVFMDKVLPKYLPPVDSRGSTKYPSFTRKLNRWGFRQITRGPDTGAFHHPLFRRDNPQLCLQMVCQGNKNRRNGSKAPSKADVSPRKLPPKKRTVNLASYSILPCVPDPNEQLKYDVSASASIISSDDSQSNRISGGASVSSWGSVSHDSAAIPTVNNGFSRHSASAPKLDSTDSPVVADSLRQTEQNERIRIAKAMLYRSYLQALGEKR